MTIFETKRTIFKIEYQYHTFHHSLFQKNVTKIPIISIPDYSIQCLSEDFWQATHLPGL
jgi:hypothetical protein